MSLTFFVTNRYTGVLGTIKIRQAGYPIRFTFAEFIQRYVFIALIIVWYIIFFRYSILAPKISILNPHEKALALAKELDLDWAKWKAGKTKLFFKDPRAVSLPLCSVDFCAGVECCCYGEVP